MVTGYDIQIVELGPLEDAPGMTVQTGPTIIKFKRLSSL